MQSDPEGNKSRSVETGRFKQVTGCNKLCETSEKSAASVWQNSGITRFEGDEEFGPISA